MGNRFFRILLLLALALAIASARAESLSRIVIERDGCEQHLSVVRKAIQAYWLDHKTVPARLQDLVPQYLHDPGVLICPVCKRTGQIDSSTIPCSYVYDSRGTNIVRCRHHDVVLNLSTDGRIFETPAVWENLLTKQAIMDEFQLKRAATAAVTPVTVARAKSHFVLWSAGSLAAGILLFVGVRQLRRMAKSEDSQKAKTLATLTIANLHTGKLTVTSVAEPPPPMPTSEEVRASVVGELTEWLKRRFMQRLISERQQLLAVQEEARRKAQAVDDRLAKIEHQIQQRNHEYEARIDDLLKALITAEEQNRELIRAQIALLRAEMEKARLRDAGGAPQKIQ